MSSIPAPKTAKGHTCKIFVRRKPQSVGAASGLKHHPGKAFKVALSTPKFAAHYGKLFQTFTAHRKGRQSGCGSFNPPFNFFADAYPLPVSRRAREAAAGRIHQIVER